MPSEKELTMYQKSTIYDLLKLLKRSQTDGKTFSYEEIEAIADAYIEGLEQK